MTPWARAVRVLAGGGLLAALAACGGPGPAADPAADHELLAAGDQPPDPPPGDGRRRVITDAAALRPLFLAMTGRAAPEVDFARHRVLLLDAGPRPTAGYAIAVGSLRRTSGALVVEIVLRRPGADCMSAAVMTRPYAFVRIPAGDRPVRLRERVERVPCE
ncbi:MAG: protease complex subunit PrcB family protein [Halofilum sp. (in: g-proteobacteria)]|nr:protease complex subunit PrcB family protein [Halofilum sp. (in: g-proteobacteria)]